jgi:uncharacterized cupin superfamily protein
MHQRKPKAAQESPLVSQLAACLFLLAAAGLLLRALWWSSRSTAAPQWLMAAAGTPSGIRVERQISKARMADLGVAQWPTWGCGVSDFPWRYSAPETFVLIAGEVTIVPEGGEPVTLQAGDMATCPAGMRCRWKVTKALEKHYR